MIIVLETKEIECFGLCVRIAVAILLKVFNVFLTHFVVTTPQKKNVAFFLVSFFMLDFSLHSKCSNSLKFIKCFR